MSKLFAPTCGLVLGFLTWITAAGPARAEVRQVGPGRSYAAPCAAFAAANDGDTIEIDAAGKYVGDVCSIDKNNLTIRGVGGRAHIEAGGKNAGGKAIWVISGRDTTVEDIELSGCTVPDMNGAGIRQQGRNLTVRRCSFHDNQNGLLGNADPESEYLIEDSEFAYNGAGDGQSHNMYIGEIKSFTLRGSYSHHAKVGHLVKSRALSNFILYNRLSDESGNASYELDISQGGPTIVLGNLMHKSATAENSSFISYAREGNKNPGSALWVVNNTFVNGRSAGTFVSVQASVSSVTLRNNVFAGPGTVCDLSSAVQEASFVGDPRFVDAARYDFSLAADSPALDKGVAAGSALGQSLAPVCQYAHPARAVARDVVGVLDQGALERMGASTRACGQLPGDTPAVDAGAPDAATPVINPPTGQPQADAAAPGEVVRDAGVRDAGVQDAAPAAVSPGDEKEDGGCRTGASGSSSASLLLGLFLVLAQRVRARRSDT